MARPFQFRLRTIFLVVAIAAVACFIGIPAWRWVAAPPPQKGQSMSGVYMVLAKEWGLAVSVSVAAFACRKAKPYSFLFYPLVGAAWAAALHGFFFMHDGGPDSGMLVGFGVVAALFVGLPMGFVAMAGCWISYGLDRKKR